MHNIEIGLPITNVDADFIDKNSGYELLNSLMINCKINKRTIVKQITPTDKNGYKYLNNTREMQRNILIKICIICQFDLQTTNKLLKSYHFLELYPKIKQEYIIIESILKQRNLVETNKRLASKGITQL